MLSLIPLIQCFVLFFILNGINTLWALKSSSILHSSAFSPTERLCSAVPPAFYSKAMQDHPDIAHALQQVQNYSIASWYTDRESYPENKIYELMQKCGSHIPTIAVYGLPNKDCGSGDSNWGYNKNTADYEKWLHKLAGIVKATEVIYVLEPDAVGLIANNGCGNHNGYVQNLKRALHILNANNPNAHIYVDVGYWRVMTDHGAQQVAQVLNTITENYQWHIKGIAINTSNYRTTREMIASCHRVKRASGKKFTCVIDTSRNNKGPTHNSEWCNAKDRGIGQIPTSNTGDDVVDYFIWIKPPGESDGECHGRTDQAMKGPAAGHFFLKHFKQLWNNGVLAENEMI